MEKINLEMNQKKIIKYYIFTLFIFCLVGIYCSYLSYKSGKIEMCLEMNGTIIKNNKCYYYIKEEIKLCEDFNKNLYYEKQENFWYNITNGAYNGKERND